VELCEEDEAEVKYSIITMLNWAVMTLPMTSHFVARKYYFDKSYYAKLYSQRWRDYATSSTEVRARSNSCAHITSMGRMRHRSRDALRSKRIVGNTNQLLWNWTRRMKVEKSLLRYPQIVSTRSNIALNFTTITSHQSKPNTISIAVCDHLHGQIQSIQLQAQ
jgi:hypothetical protein